MRAAAIRPRSRRACPPSRMPVRRLPRIALATASMTLRRDRGWSSRLRWRRGFGAFLPGDVSGHDQGRHLTGGSGGGGDRVDRVASELFGAARCPHPRGHVARDRLDVGLQRGVVLRVVRGVSAHDVHHRRPWRGARCGGSPARSRAPVRGAAGSRRARPPSARSHRRPRSRRPRTGSGPSASPASNPAPRRSGSPRYPGS